MPPLAKRQKVCVCSGKPLYCPWSLWNSWSSSWCYSWADYPLVESCVGDLSSFLLFVLSIRTHLLGRLPSCWPTTALTHKEPWQNCQCWVEIGCKELLQYLINNHFGGHSDFWSSEEDKCKGDHEFGVFCCCLGGGRLRCMADGMFLPKKH